MTALVWAKFNFVRITRTVGFRWPSIVCLHSARSNTTILINLMILVNKDLYNFLLAVKGFYLSKNIWLCYWYFLIDNYVINKFWAHFQTWLQSIRNHSCNGNQSFSHPSFEWQKHAKYVLCDILYSYRYQLLIYIKKVINIHLNIDAEVFWFYLAICYNYKEEYTRRFTLVSTTCHVSILQWRGTPIYKEVPARQRDLT